MVTMIDRVQFLKGAEAKWFAFALASVAAAVSALAPLEAGVAVPVLVFLSVASLSGLAFAGLSAMEASKAARQAAADCERLANRLARLEQQSQAPTASPVLRTTMAEVTGTVGLLGGVVRELAKNVAAQNRDVAKIKDTLKVGPKGRSETEKDAPALKVAPEPHPVHEPSREASGAEPEPSLLPTAWKSTEDELRRMRLVMQAFEADRIELHLQPIVALPQRKIRFYEALARLRLADGTLLGPSEFLMFLERLGRAPEFDRRILNRAMTVARHLISRGSEAIVGVNLSSHSIKAPDFLWSLTGLVDAAPEILGKIVLELPAGDFQRLDADRRAALAALSERGVPLSLDRAADLAFDARLLADGGIRFLKAPAELMIAAAEQEQRDPGAERSIRDVASALRREGIRLIAEHVEHEEMVPVLAELGVPLAQGFIFAAPRAVRGEVFGEKGEAHPASAGDGRSLLRRAG
ncbi:EAL domain-containing protein [Microvirga roseola]|uniref:EAL domain-containing protein n=1 Tax=Microvirga roseola TaxID=2883126 RepID=UPI001E4DAFD4|nr:EAL domain-containing protein [Microvirga roseola]